MSKHRPNLRIGARGWQFDHWQGSFYPDDLPDEWRFSYYSNEFQSVLVPAEYVKQFSVDDWVDWADDTSEEFGFYVELTAQQSWGSVVKHIDSLSRQLIGFVLLIDQNTDFESASLLVQQAKNVAPMCAHISTSKHSSDTKGAQDFIDEYQLNNVWVEGQETPCWNHHGPAVILRKDSDDNSPLVMRELLEKSFQFSGGHQQLALFFAGSNTKIDDMRSAQVIDDLLA